MKPLQNLLAAIARSLSGVTAALAEPLPISLFLMIPGDKAQTDQFTERLTQVPYLASVKKDDTASNIYMIVSLAKVPTSGGTAASTTTGLLAASTLGLIPTVENQDVSVHYELRVNGMPIAVFDYSKNFTSVSNLFGQYGKLPEEARAWLLTTIDDLARDIQASRTLGELQAEYEGYIGSK